MNRNLIALKLVLDELDEPSEISSVNDRKRVQKVIYLAQSVGVPLGYSYGWYLMGPYSPGLTRDYFALDKEEEDVAKALRGSELQPHVMTALQKLEAILKPPAAFKLEREDWYELLASYLYLRTESGQSAAKAASTMEQQKPRLARYIDLAKSKLSDAGLLVHATSAVP